MAAISRGPQTSAGEHPLHGIDLSSWQSILSTIIGLALFALIGIGIRLLMMYTIQQRRERMNRQINERLRTLIAAYKTLGGSFTGNLIVDPTHLGDLRRREEAAVDGATASEAVVTNSTEAGSGSERARRIRDAVEASLSDIILLGTEEQVRLADKLARELVAGRPIQTGELVASLRNFIREALDLDPVPSDLVLPPQGPARPSSAGQGGRGRGEQGPGRQGGAGAGMGMGGGAALGMGLGAASGGISAADDHTNLEPNK